MAITFKNVDYFYDLGTPIATAGLKNISLTIPDNSYTAIIGHTGSGKSTLLQHLNALLKPSHGEVQIDSRVITAETNNKNLKSLRKKVGIVFQFAEHQLFEETVGKDIAFGPMNFGATQAEALEIAREMLTTVGLDEKYFDVSPFDLSGGQMRRVAIAGVLALKPDILVLDEPTAGLDPKSRQAMMDLFLELHEKRGLSIILVTHQMDDVADFAEHVFILEQGQLIKSGTPQEIFNDYQFMLDHGLGLPKATQFALKMRQQGFKVPTLPLKEAELVDLITKQLTETEQ
ncbi:ABC transporter family protein [Agrilactobacillus composti DSM 18527 = JCM 14202]|uniref:Energy-coupling factor transporter ATP-binding protein EcfA2 n=1 Tax=Agrilactobacillus composti DSM 18527 = JCM 14202 TaxID=1423734 RepID=X0PSC1_9LACO|nr:energy-coupling factor ABC transporter ATP-binding protein [Agrilactobacillus composti]KRM32596.1 ABC transporter family protein [Agrilactobacillus composti DSM 18527 = JCM 14202]GAF40091.1 ATPase component of general energizing module of ECF transporters [Agrilactobacillus composti DSM 18527 = JCM 14202]